MAKKTGFEKILTYVTRLQGVANGLAGELEKILDAADAETLDKLKREYVKLPADLKKRYQAIQKIVIALERLRSAKIDEAAKLTVAEAQDVVKVSGAQTVDEVLAAYKAENEAEKAERRKRIKPLTSAQAQAILDYHPIDGASIADWFKRWKTNDLNRIAQAVQRGAIEELSVDEVAANVWNACNVSRNSARTVARTIINGVSNAARTETLFANEDAIDGIEFLATLDARTSHICGALDGTVWRGEEMKRARRPPLHPNCRSTLIPVVDLIDPETGEKIEETARRPAQNADGSYSQVEAKTTFKDYFESQPETFQREWLGEKRFELWKSGKLKFEDLAKPATTYRATTDDLTPPTEKAKETAASDDKPNNAPALLADAIRKVGGEDAAAEILRRYAADANFLGLGGSKNGVGLSKAGHRKARREALRKADSLGVEIVAASKFPGDVLKAAVEELERVRLKLKTFGLVDKIETIGRAEIQKREEEARKDPNKNGPPLASYNANTRTIRLRPDLDLPTLSGKIKANYRLAHCSTDSERHAFRHEIGHALAYAFAGKNGVFSAAKTAQLDELFDELHADKTLLSNYGARKKMEMIAEAFAVALVDETEPIFKKTEFQRARVFALRIVAVVLKDELAERLK